MSGTGSLNANGGLTISGDTTKYLENNWTLSNTGTATWSNNTAGNGAIATYNAATINNSGTWLDQNLFNNSITDICCSNQSTFNNTGTYTKSGNSTTGIGITFNNTGSVNVQNGTLQITSAFTNAGNVDVSSGAIFTGSTSGFVNGAHGEMDGFGTLGATNLTLLNDGTVAPGTVSSIGTLNVGGNYQQATTGILDIGLASLASYDVLNVKGTTSLSGAIDVYSPDNIKLQVGDTFTIALSSGAVSGTFSSINSMINGVTFSAIYDPNDVKLVVTSTSAVPIPSAIWLFGSTLFGFYIASQRKTKVSL
jgi:hypothetical protein